ncbi:hypothetical protein DEU56DRAFT_752021 [Suillus clintonianus]|uniref:uncharacterized protein n=1 Tax=Suillus clintonianus TaxID=1904413 RepID=UPI001B865733|nr:uncharacterized protein DEU56DRAFT_752021 [Suillus clintonianus]KAG2152706.1 hypothetical protein DEU56DRAFT_752021 [Suillus clintonianus]
MSNHDFPEDESRRLSGWDGMFTTGFQIPLGPSQSLAVVVAVDADSLEMDHTTVTGPVHRGSDLASTISDNAELSESPNLPPYSITTTSSDNTTQTHYNSVEQSEVITVPHESVYDAGRLSPSDLDIALEAMAQGNSRPGTPFIEVNGMEVFPDEVDETVNGPESELSLSFTDVNWYNVSQVVIAAAAAASQVELAAESNSDSESAVLRAAVMDGYIDWPNEDSE